jgi:hypothetical protein
MRFELAWSFLLLYKLLFVRKYFGYLIASTIASLYAECVSKMSSKVFLCAKSTKAIVINGNHITLFTFIKRPKRTKRPLSP